MDNARIEDANVIFPMSPSIHGKADIAFPVELLEAISKLGVSSYKLEEAVMFYGITKNAAEWYWTTPEDLEHKNLTGWEIHYYQYNWGDSRWDSLSMVQGVKKDETSSHFLAIDRDGEVESWGFDAGQNLLLVKLTDEEFAERIAEDDERVRQNDEYAARMKAEATQAKLDNPESEDPLVAWERELLNGE